MQRALSFWYGNLIGWFEEENKRSTEAIWGVHQKQTLAEGEPNPLAMSSLLPASLLGRPGTSVHSRPQILQAFPKG